MRLILAAGKSSREIGEELFLSNRTVERHITNIYRKAGAHGRAEATGRTPAAAGETLVSGTVRDLARTSAGVTFEDRGEQTLKGIDDPVRAWAVCWRDG